MDQMPTNEPVSVHPLSVFAVSTLERVADLATDFLALSTKDRPTASAAHRRPGSVSAHVAASLNNEPEHRCPLRESGRWYRSDVVRILDALNLDEQGRNRRRAREETRRERARRYARAMRLRAAVPLEPPADLLPDEVKARADALRAKYARMRDQACTDARSDAGERTRDPADG